MSSSRLFGLLVGAFPLFVATHSVGSLRPDVDRRDWTTRPPGSIMGGTASVDVHSKDVGEDPHRISKSRRPPAV